MQKPTANILNLQIAKREMVLDLFAGSLHLGIAVVVFIEKWPINFAAREAYILPGILLILCLSYIFYHSLFYSIFSNWNLRNVLVDDDGVCFTKNAKTKYHWDEIESIQKHQKFDLIGMTIIFTDGVILKVPKSTYRFDEIYNRVRANCNISQ